MARAINQATAWIAALFFSLLLFGLGLAVIFNLKTKSKDSEHGDHEISEIHQAKPSEEHPTSSHEHDTAPSKSDHSAEQHSNSSHDGHGSSSGKDSSSNSPSHPAQHDVEITPESVKAKAESHK